MVNPVVGIIGGGQLGSLLADAANKINIKSRSTNSCLLTLIELITLLIFFNSGKITSIHMSHKNIFSN